MDLVFEINVYIIIILHDICYIFCWAAKLILVTLFAFNLLDFRYSTHSFLQGKIYSKLLQLYTFTIP